MTQPSPNAPLFDDVLLDRLVDGELSNPERTALLRALDQSPDGWRRCAIAFLESQELRTALRDTPRRPVDDRAGETPRPAALPAKSPRRSTAAWLLALSLAVALSAWTGWHLGQSAGSANALASAAASGEDSTGNALAPPGHVSPPPEPTGGQRVAQGDSTPTVDDDAPAAARPAAAPHADQPNPQIAGVMQVDLTQGDQVERRTLPVLEGPGIDLAYAAAQPSPVSPADVRRLERLGQKVVVQRNLLTFPLQNGRAVVVPVDDVQVRFAGRLYQ